MVAAVLGSVGLIAYALVDPEAQGFARRLQGSVASGWKTAKIHWQRRFGADHSGAGVSLRVAKVIPTTEYRWSGGATAAVERQLSLLVEWGLDQEVRDRVTSGRLTIQDGGQTSEFSVARENMAQGSRIYIPRSTQVRIRLLVERQGGDPLTAQIIFLVPRRGGETDATVSVQAPLSRNESETEKQQEPPPEQTTLPVQRRTEPPVAQEAVTVPKPKQQAPVLSEQRPLTPPLLIEHGPAIPVPATAPETSPHR